MKDNNTVTQLINITEKVPQGSLLVFCRKSDLETSRNLAFVIKSSTNSGLNRELFYFAVF